jgi:hypothetical protein
MFTFAITKATLATVDPEIAKIVVTQAAIV